VRAKRPRFPRRTFSSWTTATRRRGARTGANLVDVPGVRVEISGGHGNIGYGRANNLVLARLDSDFHLVMNPDVELDPDALVAAIHAMQADPSIGLLAPDVCGAGGERQYLCKRYPSVWVLFLRGFAPAMLRRAFWRSLERYEMRDVLGSQPCSPVPLASGCFMVVRTAIFRRLGGFDPRFFVLRTTTCRCIGRGQGRIRPAAASSTGGEAARRGPRHISGSCGGVAFLHHTAGRVA
jgi:GT2 family glycosyltransferase